MVIQDIRTLREFCSAVPAGAPLFLDTEFVGEGRYYPEVGAIQVATREAAALVDPLAVTDLSPLFDLLRDPSHVKVFHAGDQDLAIFRRLMGTVPTPIFDAQIAAALLGYGEQISFANLVERTTRTRLHKAHSFTDWLRRPLSEGQVEYALDDVRYLVPVYDTLTAELAARGRTAWAEEEFASFANDERFRESDPRELYQRIRGADRLSGTALAALRELVAWREETARAENVSLSRIGRDEVLVELARRPRATTRELQEVRGLQPQQIGRYGKGLIEAAQRGTTAPKPVIHRFAPLPSALEPTIDFLALCLRALCAEESISPGVVATRGDLAALVADAEHADIPLMRGWRREAVGNTLLETLKGHATVRVIPETRRVHLQWADGCRP